MKKRKIRIFPILALLFVVVIVIYAINLISKAIPRNTEPDVKDESVETIEKDANLTHKEYDEADVPEQEEKPDSQSEETPSLVDDSPKPLMTYLELLEAYPNTVLSKTNDVGQSYIDDIVFIGDSTTHGMAFYGVLEGGKETTQVWTPKSGTLAMWNLLTENIVYPDDDSEMLIGDAIAIKHPKIVVLTLGVNGVSSLSEEQFKKYYSDLIDLIKEKSVETKIILQSIYPVCDYYEVKSINMEKINQANLWIAQLASEKEIFYLNTISALLNEKGYLNNDYCNGDGIHISREGFEVILEYIRTHAID